MAGDDADSCTAAAPTTPIKPTAKRNRIQLSCTHCRHAKLKCDREKPCIQCVKRGRSSLCTFLSPAARKRPPVSMRTRLKHLEDLVKEAMPGQPFETSTDPRGEVHPPAPDPALQPQQHAEKSASDAFGGADLGPNDASYAYVGATHWAAMLDDVEEMKRYFTDIDDETPLDDEGPRPDPLLFFHRTRPSAITEDLLVALPERNIVNRLISRYFNSNSPALHIIHKPTFQENYRKFWADPRSASISFLALIYSFMCLGTFAALGAGEEHADASGTPMEKIQMYREFSAQCLALSNYAQHPKPYTLETFLIYMECEFVLNKGDQTKCFLIVGIAVRLALKMGLHRDPDNLHGGKMTPYQGEIRRRVWHFLVQMDVLVSYNNGLPSMIQAVRGDARVPLNLQDQDMDENSTQLPPSRPETEMTGMSYTLAKGRLARTFGKIVEQANLLTLPSYPEITALDHELREAFSAIPSFLRLVPMDLCITDSAGLIIRRISLAVLFQSAQCILHRKYFVEKSGDSEFSYSKKAAIDAAWELLRIQGEVHDAVQPGGPLSKDLWIVSSLAVHDLLLAAAILYLCLIQEHQGDAVTVECHDTPTIRQAEMLAALERSRRIWAETRSMSANAKKAYDVIDKLLKRLASMFQRHKVKTGVPTGVCDALEPDTRESISWLSLNEPEPFPPDVSTATLQHFDAGASDDASFPNTTIDFNFDAESMPMDIAAEIGELSMDFDWELFDSYVRQPHVSS